MKVNCFKCGERNIGMYHKCRLGAKISLPPPVPKAMSVGIVINVKVSINK